MHARQHHKPRYKILYNTQQEERWYLPCSAWSRSTNELAGTCKREHAHSRPLSFTHTQTRTCKTHFCNCERKREKQRWRRWEMRQWGAEGSGARERWQWRMKRRKKERKRRRRGRRTQRGRRGGEHWAVHTALSFMANVWLGAPPVSACVTLSHIFLTFCRSHNNWRWSVREEEGAVAGITWTVFIPIWIFRKFSTSLSPFSPFVISKSLALCPFRSLHPSISHFLPRQVCPRFTLTLLSDPGCDKSSGRTTRWGVIFMSVAVLRQVPWHIVASHKNTCTKTHTHTDSSSRTSGKKQALRNNKWV